MTARRTGGTRPTSDGSRSSDGCGEKLPYKPSHRSARPELRDMACASQWSSTHTARSWLVLPALDAAFGGEDCRQSPTPAVARPLRPEAEDHAGPVGPPECFAADVDRPIIIVFCLSSNVCSCTIGTCPQPSRPWSTSSSMSTRAGCAMGRSARFIEARREIDRLESYAAAMLVAAHRRGVPAGEGASSTPMWVQFQTGQRLRDARISLAPGRRAESLPLVAKAWAQGEISANAAATIAQGRRAGHEDVYATMEERDGRLRGRA